MIDLHEDSATSKKNSSETFGLGQVKPLIYNCPADHNGTTLHIRGYIVPESQKTPIILVHDLGESSEKLSPLATLLTADARNIYCFDMRGHGQSGGRLGRISNFNQLTLDLLQVASWIKHKENQRSPIIMAQGVSAIVALFFSRFHAKFCSQMVLASPIFSLNESIRPLRRLLIKTLAELTPNLNLPSKLCPLFTYSCSKDRKKTKVPPKFTAILAYELMLAIAQTKKVLQRHKIPTLFISSSREIVTKNEYLKRQIYKNKHKFSDVFELELIDTEEHQLLTSSDTTLSQVYLILHRWLEELEEKEKTLQEG